MVMEHLRIRGAYRMTLDIMGRLGDMNVEIVAWILKCQDDAVLIYSIFYFPCQ